MEDILTRAEGYKRQSLVVGRAQYIAGERASRMHNRLGIPVIVFSTIVGTSIFATIGGEEPGTGLTILVGLVSTVAAILAALQTFFSFGEKAVNHKTAGSRYAILRREIDMFGLRYKGDADLDRNTALSELEELAKRLGHLAHESPHVPDRIYKQAKKEQLESGSP